MINRTIIEKILNLSKIGLKEKEKESLQKDLSDILDYIEKIDELKIKESETLLFKIKEYSKAREDEIESFDNKKGIVALFSEKEGSFLKVKSVFK